MEREANYTAVGAFVLLVIAMAGAFVYWYSAAGGHRDYKRYEVYFDGSVAGLTRGAAVRYLGVDVGRVVDMDIDQRNPGRVQVLVDIESGTPVSARTVAELSQQGVTGVLYIDLSSEPGNRNLLELVPSEKYPVIRSSRSNLDLLLANLPEMVGRATAVLDRIDMLLDDRNLKSMADTFTNLNAGTALLPGTLKDLQQLSVQLRGTSLEITRTAVSARNLTDSIGSPLRDAIANTDAVTRNLTQATISLNRLIDENRTDLRQFTRDGLPAMEQLLGAGRSAAGEVRDFAHSLREEPSQLMFEKTDQGVQIPP